MRVSMSCCVMGLVLTLENVPKMFFRDSPALMTSGTVPSRNYWFKEILLSSATQCSVSRLATANSQYNTLQLWNSAQRSLINTLFFYPPLESTEHSYKETVGVNIWDNGTLKLFRGKCYIIVMLKFMAQVGENGTTNDTDLKYQLCVTSANLKKETPRTPGL